MKRLAVLASGEGTLLERMIRKNLPIELVITDRACKALDIAVSANIPASVVERTFDAYFDRDRFTYLVVDILKRNNIDLVAMAGFMTKLGPTMFFPDAYRGRVLNTHPSLLPLHKGKDPVRKALHSGATLTGFSIHIATEELDDGPIIFQQPVDILPGDTEETLHERIKQHERILYIRLLRQLVKEKSS